MVPGEEPLYKNLTRQKWNFKGGVEVHVIYKFYISKTQQNIVSYKI